MNGYWFLASFLVLSNACLANPKGFELIQGQAHPPVAENQTMVIETGSDAIIHWNEFSIAEGEITRFVMPDSHFRVLNRVMGDNLSEIYGALEANGNVILVNPKGVLFGENASIDTASFIASSLDVLDSDFLKNGELLFSGDSRASIVNLGTISAWDGDVALIGYHVENRGGISAPNGVAALAAGRHVLIRPLDNERIAIRIALPDEQGETGIENTGYIQAIAAELKADGNAYEYAIQDSGRIDALGVEERQGRIFLVAEQGVLSAKGSYRARSNGEGGELRFLGETVWIEEGAELVSSGESSGGCVLIGGDYQGKNPAIPNAKITYVAIDTHIAADAELAGDGGKVILWGDNATGFYGSISAQGGSVSGDGGFVEVSSPGYLAFNGLANTSAPFGTTGMLLLDPSQITISTGDTWSFTCAGGYNIDTPSGTIDSTNLGNNLGMCSVTIDATNNSGGGAPPGTITVNDSVTWNMPNTLTFAASDPNSMITINAPLTATAGGSININDGGTYNTALSINNTNVTTTGAGGTIEIQTGSVSIIGAATNASASLQTNGANAPITIDTNGLTVLGGTNFHRGSIVTEGANSDISFTCNGLVDLTTGTGAEVRIETTGSNSNISIQSIGLTLDASLSFNSVIVETNTGTISIDGYDATHSGPIFFNCAGSLGGIFTEAEGSILIGQNGNQIPTNFTILTNETNGAGLSVGGQPGDLLCTISGDYFFQTPMDSFEGSIQVGTEFGNISMIGKSLTLIGGSAPPSPFFFAVINIGSGGELTNSTTLMINMQEDVVLTAGSAKALVRIGPDGVGELAVNCRNLTLNGGSAGSPAQLLVGNGGDIAINCSNLTAIGGTGSSPAQITTPSGDIAINCSDLTITGGPGTSPAQITTGSGMIAINCSSLTATGGSVTSPAQITSGSGDIAINCAGNCTFNAQASDSPAQLQTFGSDLALIAGGDATFSGFTQVSTPAPTGNLLIIAGRNLTIEGHASIRALGKVDSSLTLVCDNDYPSPPAFGPGEFNLTGDAVVSAGTGTPVRIFTSLREQNSISDPINGVPFIPGIEFVDSSTEQWGVYYFNSFGGQPFTIFYKLSGLFPFDTSQNFFDLAAMDFFVYFDWYHWSDFVVNVRNEEMTGHSIRKRSGEFLKNNVPRGFSL